VSNLVKYETGKTFAKWKIRAWKNSHKSKCKFMLHEGRALKKLTTYQQDKVNINLIKKKYQKFINKK
jgi:hypothetical protein